MDQSITHDSIDEIIDIFKIQKSTDGLDSSKQNADNHGDISSDNSNRENMNLYVLLFRI
jgi:hypothetical protein